MVRLRMIKHKEEHRKKICVFIMQKNHQSGLKRRIGLFMRKSREFMTKKIKTMKNKLETKNIFLILKDKRNSNQQKDLSVE